MTSRWESSKRAGIAIAALVLVAAGLITYITTRSTDDGATASSSETAQANPLAELPRREPNDPLALGDPDAPVAMVMYEDFRCPFCAKFSRDIAPTLIERYVDNGVLRMEWRDLPIFGEQSMAAARAGRAAAEQDRFWEFTRAVYAESPPRGHPDLTEKALVRFARKAEVPDLVRFTDDMKSDKYDTAINADRQEGVSIGVSSTPTFVVNGEPILGAQPVDTFATIIESAAERE